jgi:hypothetical protein
VRSYKKGKKLTSNDRHALFVRNRETRLALKRALWTTSFLPRMTIIFVYPNSYHQYQRQYNGTFQHGGVSMEEIILPIALAGVKKKR